MPSPDLSVIIPVYNRDDLIRYTLESVRRASVGLAIEIVIVDDGSAEPASDSIARLGYRPDKIIRQPNQGLLFARLAGLRHATGSHILFLDSDDLVSPEKFRLQLDALRATGADVSYTDQAHVVIEGDYDAICPVADAPLADTTDGTEFFIKIQPAPHAPIFRADYLRRIVADAFFPPSPLYNAVAEIWFYQNAAAFPARAVRVPGPHTIIGAHPGVRLTNHWERLGVASLAVMEAFARGCPTDTETARRARQLLGETAFLSWRKLPRDFFPEFQARELALSYRLAPRLRTHALGGRGFQLLSRFLGIELAARILRRLRGGRYEPIRTMDDATFRRLLSALPAP